MLVRVGGDEKDGAYEGLRVRWKTDEREWRGRGLRRRHVCRWWA